MAAPGFEWDGPKARSNRRKHGVSFEEALTVYPNHLCSPRDEAGEGSVQGASTMRKEYDFSKGKKNPYTKALKKQITIRLDEPTIAYFRQLSSQTGLPYQSLMNLYLRDCAAQHRRLRMDWAS